MIIKFIDVINIVFPQICGICGKINKDGLCNQCRIKLEGLAQYSIICEDFKNKYFNELIYIFKYEGLIRNLIIDYKFNEKSYMYVCFVKCILENEKIYKKLQSYDAIISVPISKKRMKERGYNQSFLIAKELSNRIKIDLQTNCLWKTKHIIEQSKLNKEQRKENIQNVYELKNGEILNNKQILLIDDIYTTGNTVNECAKILQQGTPKKIDVLVLAKD